MPKYDFSDQAVYSLVLHTHRPVEVWTKDTGTLPSELQLVCDIDREPWPCVAMTELRSYDKRKATGTSSSGAEVYQQRLKEGRING